MNRLRPLVLASAVSLLPSLAHAHPSLPGAAGGFTGGLAHPLIGLDHLLAVIGIGAIAAQLGGRPRWLLPLTFALSMLAGLAIGLTDLRLPAVEFVITLSVVAVGAALALHRSGLAPAVVIAAALFGLFHGHAHGAEMPLLAVPALYAAGILAMTSGLLAASVLLASWAFRWQTTAAGMRLAGAAIALLGIAWLVG